MRWEHGSRMVAARGLSGKSGQQAGQGGGNNGPSLFAATDPPMFASLRKALSLGIPPEATHHPASLQEVAHWAAARGMVLEPDEVPGGYALSGQQAGVAWRIECGTPTRSYIQGMELRGGADTGAPPALAVMVLGRALQESLEGRAGSESAGPGPVDEEVRWLAATEEVAWEDLPPAFVRHYAVLSTRIESAQRWLHPELVSLLMNGLPVTSALDEAGAAPADRPFVMMLSHGHVYLRMAHANQSLQSLAQGVDILVAAARSAVKGFSRSH